MSEDFTRTQMHERALLNIRKELVTKKRDEFTKQIRNEAGNGETDTVLTVGSLRGAEKENIRAYLEKRGFSVTPVRAGEWIVKW